MSSSHLSCTGSEGGITEECFPSQPNRIGSAIPTSTATLRHSAVNTHARTRSTHPRTHASVRMHCSSNLDVATNGMLLRDEYVFSSICITLRVVPFDVGLHCSIGSTMSNQGLDCWGSCRRFWSKSFSAFYAPHTAQPSQFTSTEGTRGTSCAWALTLT